MKSTFRMMFCALQCWSWRGRAGQATAQGRRRTRSSVGVFPLSSSLPYFVALERGFFKEAEHRAGNDQADGRSGRMWRR